MTPVNYEIKDHLTFPFSYGIQHFKITFSNEHVEWGARVVHLLIGALEMVPLVNYIVAIADRIFHPNWLWEFVNSKIDFEELPQLDQSDIHDPNFDEVIPGHKIRSFFDQHNHYKWFEILTKELGFDRMQRKWNSTIEERTTQRIMKGRDSGGQSFLIISRPCTRPEYISYSSLLQTEMRGRYEGKEVSIIFEDGRLMNIFRDSLSNHYNEISRLPETSPGLMEAIQHYSSIRTDL